MHFDNGKFGAVVIVIALVLTVVLGYCTDVSKVEVERTDYDFITDVTGLFETEQIPEYIEYNPNSNYVGYTGNVQYVPSVQPNNYRYVIENGTTTTQSLTVSSSSSYPASGGFLPSDVGTQIYINYTGSYWNMGSATSFSGIQYNIGGDPVNVTSLREVLSTISNLNTYDTVSITPSYGSEPVWIIGKTWTFTEVARGDNLSQYIYSMSLADSEIPDTISYNPVTELATAYKGGQILWQKNSGSVQILYKYSDRSSGSFSPANASVSFSIATTTAPTYGYADPQGGAYLLNDTEATWDNGYTVENVRFLVGMSSSISTGLFNSLYVTFNAETESGTESYETYIIMGRGSGLIVGHGGDQWTFGQWKGVILDFNYMTGELVAIPTSTISDYTTGSSTVGTPQTISEGWVNGDVEPISTTMVVKNAQDGYGDLRFGVLSTSVFLNSYGVVMNDPSININDYWPDLDSYRLNFYSFALVGNSISINGTTYPIGPGQTILVTDTEGNEYNRTLTNIYITTNDGHTYLTFVNDDLTVDLGETVTESVSFDGLWYFTTALYEATTVTGSEYEWDVDGTFNATAQQVLVIFLGILASGVIVGKVLLKHEFGLYDWLLIIGAGVVAFAFAGVFF